MDDGWSVEDVSLLMATSHRLGAEALIQEQTMNSVFDAALRFCG